MKILMSIKDRIAFPQLFNPRASLGDKMMELEMLERVKLSELEKQKTGYKVEKGLVTANVDVYVEDKECEFSNMELNFLKDRVQELDKDKKISIFMVELCMKIKAVEIKLDGKKAET